MNEASSQQTDKVQCGAAVAGAQLSSDIAGAFQTAVSGNSSHECGAAVADAQLAATLDSARASQTAVSGNSSHDDNSGR